MFRNSTLLAAALALLLGAESRADEVVLGQMYGSGVHAYFSRDYVKAYDYLTLAIDGGTLDPRCYYFRGLAYIKLGREPEAEIDFAQGANRESRDVDRFYNVSRSLGRIQGNTRLVLERYRAKARLAAMKQAEEARKARYAATRAEEPRVLHEPRGVAPAPPDDVSPGPVAPPIPEPESEGIFAPEPPAPAEGGAPSTTPAVEPAPVEPTPPTQPAPVTDGQRKPGGIFGALRNAVGKAITGGGGESSTAPDGGGQTVPMADDLLKRLMEGAQQPGPPGEGNDPFAEEPVTQPPAEAPHVPPAEAPHVPPAEAPHVPPAEAPHVPPAEAPHVPPAEPPDDPFADTPSEPASGTPAEPPADTSGQPAVEPEPIPEPPADPFAG